MEDIRGRDAAAHGEAQPVPDDRPVRVEQPRLRRPAAWSLALGAASLVPLSVSAFRADEERMVSPSGSLSGPWVDLGGLVFFVAGCFACMWLVRVQWLLARAQRIHTMTSDVGPWLMWVVPILMWILPGVRISRWDKMIHGRRSWVVIGWAVLWVPSSFLWRWTPDGPAQAPDPARAWWFVCTAVVTFGLWAATVVRLTRGCEVVAHETGLSA